MAALQGVLKAIAGWHASFLDVSGTASAQTFSVESFEVIERTPGSNTRAISRTDQPAGYTNFLTPGFDA